MREQGAGKPDSAAALYPKVLQAEPTNHGALHSLGIIAYRRKDLRGAIEWIQRAIRVQPNEANYYNYLGRLPARSGKIGGSAGELPTGAGAATAQRRCAREYGQCPEGPRKVLGRDCELRAGDHDQAHTR